MMPPDPSSASPSATSAAGDAGSVILAGLVLVALVAVAVVVLLPKDKQSAATPSEASTQASQGTGGSSKTKPKRTVDDHDRSRCRPTSAGHPDGF